RWRRYAPASRRNSRASNGSTSGDVLTGPLSAIGAYPELSLGPRAADLGWVWTFLDILIRSLSYSTTRAGLTGSVPARRQWPAGLSLGRRSRPRGLPGRYPPPIRRRPGSARSSRNISDPRIQCRYG